MIDLQNSFSPYPAPTIRALLRIVPLTLMYSSMVSFFGPYLEIRWALAKPLRRYQNLWVCSDFPFLMLFHLQTGVFHWVLPSIDRTQRDKNGPFDSRIAAPGPRTWGSLINSQVA
jgi:hypothetical protein